MTYYERSNIVHIDGSPIFRSQEDAQAETAVADLVAKAWRCEICPFGALSPIDWYANRADRLIGLLELKTRSHPSTTYPNVWLNVRKWLALSLGSVGLGVPALFVVKFTDGIWWTPIATIDATQTRIAGCTRLVKAKSDIEPIIYVPFTQFRSLPLS